MCRRRALVSRWLCAIGALAGPAAAPADALIGNGGFEAGLAAPWGTGLYSEGRPVWWNSQGCRSEVVLDETVAMQGLASLHIINPSTRAAQVYGTMAQRIPIEPNRPYRITVWARGLDLASAGAVSVVVDDAWQVRPIALPAGTYAWTRLSATFSLPADHADIRVLIEDAGEAWLDDVQVIPLDSVLY